MSNQEINKGVPLRRDAGAHASHDGHAPGEGEQPDRPAMSGMALARTGSRWGIALPAAVLTLASYFAMNGLISVEFEEPEITLEWALTTITPQRIDEPPETIDRFPKALPTADLPPPPPPILSTVSNVGVPVGNLAPVSPELPQSRLDGMIAPSVAVFGTRIVQPLSPPVVIYPDSAAREGLEGDCEVHLNVDIRGNPFDVEATCTDRVFERAARRAVERVQFAPRIDDGRPVEQHGVVYPMEFRME